MEMNLNEAKKRFVQLRSDIDKLVQKTPVRQLDMIFGEKFSDIYIDATQGDIVAQDYLGYIFKRGKLNLVPENIDLSMKWLLLAAANGNAMSIHRLLIFLNYAFDEIIYQDDFEYMAFRNNITKENHTQVLGELVCQAIVDELNIDASNIIKQVPTSLPFNSSTMNIYDNARNNSLPVVLAFLRGIILPAEPKEQEVLSKQKQKKEKINKENKQRK